MKKLNKVKGLIVDYLLKSFVQVIIFVACLVFCILAVIGFVNTYDSISFALKVASIIEIFGVVIVSYVFIKVLD